ncbi:MAG: FemAB family XrtA/PEP-CTERM system-associated protein [Syntrophorhabdales bacterium]|jgi:FemAB-related protein (PEP-CTERM system-associated)
MSVRIATTGDKEAWDDYVATSPRSSAWHLWGWRKVIGKTYGHTPYYLLATDESKIEGVLPLFHLKSLLFGNMLVSMPFLDGGGLLTDTDDAGRSLLLEAVNIARRTGASTIELRHLEPPTWLAGPLPGGIPTHGPRPSKVRMLLALPGSSEVLVNSFKAKLRSQIKRPSKEGCRAVIGGMELLDQFYRVFLVTMRDLGSPVHSKTLFVRVLQEFSGNARIFLVTKEQAPIAGSLTISLGDTVVNPWASSLRAFSALSPNMLLYWTMLEFACNNGFRFFDFGRSSPDGGTYRFKAQWGAAPVPLNWGYISLSADKSPAPVTAQRNRLDRFTRYWKRLPVGLTSVLGPVIRRQISL